MPHPGPLCLVRLSPGQLAPGAVAMQGLLGKWGKGRWRGVGVLQSIAKHQRDRGSCLSKACGACSAAPAVGGEERELADTTRLLQAEADFEKTVFERLHTLLQTLGKNKGLRVGMCGAVWDFPQGPQGPSRTSLLPEPGALGTRGKRQRGVPMRSSLGPLPDSLSYQETRAQTSHWHPGVTAPSLRSHPKSCRVGKVGTTMPSTQPETSDCSPKPGSRCPWDPPGPQLVD